MALMLKGKKFFAYLIIFIAHVMGLIAIGEFIGERDYSLLAMYVLFGLIPFLVGFILMRGKQIFYRYSKGKYIFTLKKLYSPNLRVYLYITIAIPCFYSLMKFWNLGKYQKLANIKDIWLFPASYMWLDYFLIITGLLSFIMAGRIFVAGLKEVERSSIAIFSFSFLLTASIILLTNNDFEAVRKDGIVTQKLGKMESIPWADVKNVGINGYLSQDGFSSTASKSFKWEFIFYLKNGKDKVIGPFYYGNSYLGASLDIKKLIIEKRIPMSTDRISEKEWDFIEVDMEYNEGSPEDFYTFFQFDPESKKYYNIPYE
ncbi:hypothetical protein DRW41_15705 [Neobacillus piezotolerans]|uniref:Uncharacterized protein n=1 Tax=Neobacillus piezotolerans TaxID=2259171 RepID=A0A3D8GP16_9BACI|nr:hypothetical protein [Neobacillus piezotolerans]RDU36032.1 hypothetical protein DRW41_15705 [Neobacillus piezotolerans]